MAYSPSRPLYRTMRVVRALFVFLVVVRLALYARHGYRHYMGRDPRLAPFRARIAEYSRIHVLPHLSLLHRGQYCLPQDPPAR
jgi:hypothetical protein